LIVLTKEIKIVAELNFTRKYDVAYPAGRFDLALNLMDGNPLLYRFFGNRVYFSLYKMLNADEQDKITKLAESCVQTPNTPFEECVHITDGDNTECYVVSMTKIPDENAYYVELMNVTNNKCIINNLNTDVSMARDFITLQGEAIFTYNNDSNHFHMYIVNGSQNVELFNMDFDEWASLITSKKLIADDDIEIFDAFCYIIKKSSTSQVFKFHGSVLSNHNAVEKYKVSFTPKSYPEHPKFVIGKWAIINEITNDVEDTNFDASHVDGLTGLLNKKAIMEYAQNAVEAGPQSGSQLAISVMDIDNFKGVNDNFGHLFGDKVIKAVGEIIKDAIGSDAVAGRMGGDEFLIVFEKFNDELEYRNVLRCIKTKVNYVYQNKFGADNQLTCSIGLGRYGFGSCSTSFNDLFKIADRALYLAKQKGKNRYIIYKPELHGDFVTPNDDDTVNIGANYYTEPDIDAINQLLSDMIIYGSDVINELIGQLSKVLMFDRINIFLRDDAIPKYFVSSSGEKDNYSNPDIIKNKKYISIFTKRQITISNIHGIEYTLPDTYSMLNDEGIASLMQFLLIDKDGNIAGFITGEVFEHFAAFPKIAISIFETASRAINSVLIREGKI
jgi:diguanylate cyclase (GGDEF)-like protein